MGRECEGVDRTGWDQCGYVLQLSVESYMRGLHMYALCVQLWAAIANSRYGEGR